MQIKEPVVCGIASLGMDHMETLGMLLLYIYRCILNMSFIYKL